MRYRGFAAVFGLIAVLGGPVVAFGPRTGGNDPREFAPPTVSAERQLLDPGETTPLGSAARAFLDARGQQWVFQVDRRVGRPTLVQGAGIPMVPGRGNSLGAEALAGLTMEDGYLTLDDVDPLVRGFIDGQGSLLRPASGDLVLDRETSLVREDGRLASFYYQWTVQGIPVEEAYVFVRLNSGNVTQFGAPLVADDPGVSTEPTVPADQAVRLLMDYSGDDEVYRLVDEPQLIIRPQDGRRGDLEYRLVWKINYRVPDRIETWQGSVDAHTGELLGFVDTNRYARAVGGVYPRTVFDGDETIVPFPDLDVVAGSVVTADTAGVFTYGGGTISSGLNGRWFNTNCQGCSNPTQPGVATSVGLGWLDFGLGGADNFGNGRSTPADRNSFYHLTQLRRIALKWLPGLGWLNNTINSNVNIDNLCNAVYNGAVNFYRSGGGCNNTGEISDVMHHEYGHGLDGNTRGGDGATGEATADVVAIHMSHSPLIGPGFNTNGAPVRNIDSATSSRGFLTATNVGSVCPVIGSLGPLGTEVHCEGEIYGQAAWELSQAFVAKHGFHTGWRTSERIFFTSLPDAGGYWPAATSFSVYDAYVNADDDDGNMANGTPNGEEIFNAFDSHGIACDNPPCTPLSSSTPCTRPAQPTLTVLSSCDVFDLSWSEIVGIDHYEIFRAEVRLDSAFFPLASVPSGTTSYTDTEVAPGADYWYVVMAVDGTGCESTVESPQPAKLTAQPILSVTAAVNDDTPRGNRSGFADPGEEVDIELTLANFGEVDGTVVSGTVIPMTPGVTMLDDSDPWPDLLVGGSGGNAEVLRFETDDLQVACGDVLQFQFMPTDASGCSSDTSFFEVTIGERVVETQDDFESDLGWAPDLINSTASTGTWVLGDPDGTTYQPELDNTPGGTQAWFTATNGGGDGTDDVDNGVSILLSPLYDLSSLSQAELSYFRWFANSSPGSDNGDFFAVDVSDDGGMNWTNVETLDFTVSEPSWVRRTFALEALIPLTSQMVFRVQAADGAASGSIVEAAIDDFAINRFQCDPTPACFIEPTFAGLAAADQGGSCAETVLSWAGAGSNCLNATISYNVYRSVDPGFTPGPADLIASEVSGTTFLDTLLDPGQTYHYVVRAFDSRSGEDSNSLVRSVLAPTGPDLQPPVFAGVDALSAGAGCGEAALQWSAALETCNAPVSYEIYRSTDPAFTPGPATRIGSTLSTTFTDAALAPGTDYSYIVRARDGAGNEEANLIRLDISAAVLDAVEFETPFELSNEGWTVADNPGPDFTGSWEWGDPATTTYQTGDDATPDPGVNAWITGLGTQPSNNDVDDGSTVLTTSLYDLQGTVDAAVRYSRYFTNDRGASPNDLTDHLVVEVSVDQGANWFVLEDVACDTPCTLGWVDVEIPLNGVVVPSFKTQFRFSVADLGDGSLVEAGIDEFRLVDRGQGCLGCALPVDVVGTISVNRVGDDVVLDWTADPSSGTRFAVYKLGGADFGEAVRIGTTDVRSFVHEGAALAAEDFSYRVTAIDDCGNEGGLQ